VENQVAKTVNKRWSEKMDIGILKGKIEKYPVPVNCVQINNMIYILKNRGL
jgi:hypothetical protein